MKRLLIATFVFFYTTVIVVSPAQHTFSWVSALSDAAKPQPAAKRMHSPHSSQSKFVEQQFVVERLHAETPLIVVAPTTHPPTSEQLTDNTHRLVLSRAPPATS
jgi:hypothetical protein